MYGENSDCFRFFQVGGMITEVKCFLGRRVAASTNLCAKATSFHSFGAEDLRVSVFLGSWRSKICMDFLMAKYIHWRSKSWTKINIWIHELRICPNGSIPGGGRKNSWSPEAIIWIQQLYTWHTFVSTRPEEFTGETPWWCWSEHWRLYIYINIYIYMRNTSGDVISVHGIPGGDDFWISRWFQITIHSSLSYQFYSKESNWSSTMSFSR